MNGNEFLPNFAEHLVPLAEKKLVLPKKIGIVSLGVVLTLAVFLLAFSVLGVFASLAYILLLAVWFLIWYLWRFVSVEFEYTVLQGEISIDIIYGRRQRKPYYSTPISRVEQFAPLKGDVNFPQNAEEYGKILFAASTRTNPNTWYAKIREEDGRRTLLFFEMTEKTEKILRFYNARAFFGA